MRALFLLGLSLALTHGAFAQTADSDPIIANPNRPTVANPADISQFGVLEVEYGFTAARTLQSMDGLLKFPFAKDFELRIDTNTFLHDASVHSSGVGDTGVGLQWRIVHQSKRAPAIAVSYSLKVPTANDILGSGKCDHRFIGLLSKDIGKIHIDANVGYFLLARPQAAGFDHLLQPALAMSTVIRGKWGATWEISGTSRVAATSSTTSLLGALTYQAKRRLVFDMGATFGVHGDIPGAAAIVGVTYSIFDLYHPSRR